MLCADLRRPPPPEQVKKFGAADKRSLVINECLQGVRTVKLNAWEEVVARRAAAARAAELASLRRIARLRAAQQFLGQGVPTLATVPVFILYRHLNNSLRPSTVFAAVGMFEFLAAALTIIPNLGNEVRRHLVVPPLLNSPHPPPACPHPSLRAPLPSSSGAPSPRLHPPHRQLPRHRRSTARRLAAARRHAR